MKRRRRWSDWSEHPLAVRARWLGHRARSYLRAPALFLVYHEAYRWKKTGLIDPLRAEKILQYLVKQGLLTSRHIVAPKRASIAQLQSVHSAEYLEHLNDPDTLIRVFGGHVGAADVHDVIEQQRWMVGGTLAAARTVLALPAGRSQRLAVNLGGGMHHATREKGGGFCLFHDIAIALMQLRREGFAGRVLVVDLDLHQGDGTRSIFADDPDVITCSLHGVDWDEGVIEGDINVPLGQGVSDGAYLEAIDRTLPEAFERARPDLVFYVGGVDVAEDDRLGNWRISAEGVLARDLRLLALLEETPMVWTLAGGYGEEAWRYTARTLSHLMGGDGSAVPSSRDLELLHFREIARRLGKKVLTQDPDDTFEVTMADLMGDLVDHGPTKLLNFYSSYGVELALERYGVLAKLRAQGFRDIELKLHLDYPTGQMVRVHSADERRDVLIELVLRERLDLESLRLLSVEWLLLQNPRRASAHRRLLPGQTYPGLGCLEEVVMMLIMACERLGFDGLLFHPAHYHMASLVRGFGVFVTPKDEALFAAVTAALEGCDLLTASALVGDGRLRDATNQAVFQWPAAKVVCPLSEAAKARFLGPAHARSVEEEAKNIKFELVTSSPS